VSLKNVNYVTRPDFVFVITSEKKRLFELKMFDTTIVTTPTRRRFALIRQTEPLDLLLIVIYYHMFVKREVFI